MKAVVGAFNQEKALVGAFSVIVQPVVEPMDSFTALFSGGVDGSVRCWTIPPPSVDPYDTYDASVMFAVMEGHQDSVWCLSYNTARQQLLSCSADGTVKLWSPTSAAAPLVSTLYTAEEGGGVPTSCDWVTGDLGQLVVGFNNAAAVIYDAETGATVTRLDTGQVEC